MKTESPSRIKTCIKCGFFFSGRNCGQCLKVWRQKNKEKIKLSKIEWLARNSNWSSEYYKNNKERIKEVQKIYREKSGDKRKQSVKRYYENNKDKCLERNREARAKNPEKYRLQKINYAKLNPEIMKISNSNRRARVLRGGGKISKGIVEWLMAKQKGKCVCCGNKLGKNFHLDHIFPLALGGSNCDSNLQLLTASCNRRKGAKDPIYYMQSKGFLL